MKSSTHKGHIRSLRFVIRFPRHRHRIARVPTCFGTITIRIYEYECEILNIRNALFVSVTIRLIYFKYFHPTWDTRFFLIIIREHLNIIVYFAEMAKTVTQPPNMENIGNFRKVSI